MYHYAGFYGRNSACIFPCEKVAPEIAVDLRIEYFLLDCIHGIKARLDTFRGMERVAERYADSDRKGAHEYALFPHLNVAENIGFGLNLKKVDKDVIAQKVTRMLKMVGLEGFEKRDVTLLSGGQQQRVAIARALVNEPKILLLDEPLGALDAKIRKQMQIELKKIQREVGITFIYVTHDQEEALSMSDTVVVMNNGEIQQIGSPTDIYNEPENRFVAGFIGESNIIEGIMIRDYLVQFDGFEFECVDKGFEDNEEIEVVLRPEDLDIVEPSQAKISGVVRNVTFKGVHYEILVETELRTYKVQTTDYAEVGRQVGLKFGPEDIHVMYRMGAY